MNLKQFHSIQFVEKHPAIENNTVIIQKNQENILVKKNLQNFVDQIKNVIKNLVKNHFAKKHHGKHYGKCHKRHHVKHHHHHKRHHHGKHHHHKRHGKHHKRHHKRHHKLSKEERFKRFKLRLKHIKVLRKRFILRRKESIKRCHAKKVALRKLRHLRKVELRKRRHARRIAKRAARKLRWSKLTVAQRRQIKKKKTFKN